MAYGPPIALNVVGGRARYMLEENGVDANHVWSTFLNDYKTSDHLLSGLAFHNDQEEKLMNVLLSSFDMIDNGTAEQNSRQLFSQLSIIQKRQQVPFDVVQRIWGLSEDETRRQIEILRRFSVIELSVLHIHRKKKRCIGLHDVFIDLTRQLAEVEQNCMKNTAERVLLSYVREKNRSSNEGPSNSGTKSDSTSKRKVKKFVSKAKRFFKSSQSLPNNPFKKIDNRSKYHESWVSVDDDGFVMRNMFRFSAHCRHGWGLHSASQ